MFDLRKGDERGWFKSCTMLQVKSGKGTYVSCGAGTCFFRTPQASHVILLCFFYLQYCSVTCQTKDWKTHKQWCKLTEEIPIHTQIVQGNPTQGNDFIDMNRVFDYAGDYLEDLQQFHFFIPEMAIVTYRSGSFVSFKFECMATPSTILGEATAPFVWAPL